MSTQEVPVNHDEHTDIGTALVQSEIGTLKSVIIHSPDLGIGAVVPQKATQWLYEDIVDLGRMQDEWPTALSGTSPAGGRLVFLRPPQPESRAALCAQPQRCASLQTRDCPRAEAPAC